MNGIATFRGQDFYQGPFEVLVLGMGAEKGYLFDHGPRVAYDAMTSERSCRSGGSHSTALEEVREQTSAQLGPVEAQACLTRSSARFLRFTMRVGTHLRPIAASVV